jgi:hypothetical protein
MRFEIPVSLRTVFCGKAGNSGQFTDSSTGELIDFAEAYAFDFDSADGNVQRLNLRGNKIAEVADSGFDIDKLQRYKDEVLILGNAVINSEGRSFLKPIRIGVAPKAAAA